MSRNVNLMWQSIQGKSDMDLINLTQLNLELPVNNVYTRYFLQDYMKNNPGKYNLCKESIILCEL